MTFIMSHSEILPWHNSDRLTLTVEVLIILVVKATLLFIVVLLKWDGDLVCMLIFGGFKRVKHNKAQMALKEGTA